MSTFNVEETISYLVDSAYDNSAEHGFWDEYDDTLAAITDPQTSRAYELGEKYTLEIKLSKIALMMSELGEAVEGIRKPARDQHLPHLTQEAVELADVLIRIFDYCGKFNVPLAEALLAKMQYNVSRPYKHGKGA